MPLTVVNRDSTINNSIHQRRKLGKLALWEICCETIVSHLRSTMYHAGRVVKSSAILLKSQEATWDQMLSGSSESCQVDVWFFSSGLIKLKKMKLHKLRLVQSEAANWKGSNFS